MITKTWRAHIDYLDPIDTTMNDEFFIQNSLILVSVRVLLYFL